MNALLDLQHRFAEALAATDGRMLDGLVEAGRFSTLERLAVYRNNHVSTLLRTLASGFPVLHRRMGPEDFGTLTAHYVSLVPSVSGNLNDYGDRFGTEIAGHPLLRGREYLADVARLEWARQEAYLAAECAPLDLTCLDDCPAESYGALCFALHPAVRLVSCDWRVTPLLAAPDDDVSTWRPIHEPNGVLVIRRDQDVELLTLPDDEFRFLQAVAAGSSLAEAYDAAAGGDFDVAAVLGRHVALGVIVAIRPGRVIHKIHDDEED